jgi:hypothetical protein
MRGSLRITPARWRADFKEGVAFIRGGGRLVAAGYTAIGLPGILAFPVSPIALIAPSYGLTGFSVPLITTPLGAWIMDTVPQGMLGKVVAALSTLVLCATPLGSSLSGAAAEIVPIPWLFASMGILTAFVVLPVVDRGPVS